MGIQYTNESGVKVWIRDPKQHLGGKKTKIQAVGGKSKWWDRDILGREKYCINCGTAAVPRRKVKGSLVLEVLLYFPFIFPGLIYSIWRSASQHKVCLRCGAPNMIPLDSPNAIRYRVLSR